MYSTLHRALKRAGYEKITPDPERPVIEHVLFAACLENASYDAARGAYAAIEFNFIDWNEVRVTTARELTDILTDLPRAEEAAERIREFLQSIFESAYSFDLEGLRKMNQGAAVEQIKKMEGHTPFILSYVTQSALGGHSIPIDDAALGVLAKMGVLTEKQIETKKTPGLERTIPKPKGVEFAGLLHQFAIEFTETPYDAKVLKVIKSVNPSVAKGMAKEAAALAAEEEEEKKAATAAKRAATRKANKEAATSTAKAEAAKTEAATPKTVAKKSAKKTEPKKTEPKKTVASKPANKKKAAKTATDSTVNKKAVAKKKSALPKKSSKKKSAPTKKAAPKKVTKKKTAKKK